MGNVAYELREEYAGQVEHGEDQVQRFQGGVIAVPPDQASFDIKEHLEDGGGLIVVDESNSGLVDLLDRFPALKRVQAPEGAEAIGAYDSLTAARLKEIFKARGLEGPIPSKKDDLVAALEASDAGVAAGDQEAADNPSAGDGDDGEEG